MALTQVFLLNNIADYVTSDEPLAHLLRVVPITLNQILSLPIYNRRSDVVGVVQFMNKVSTTKRKSL